MTAPFIFITTHPIQDGKLEELRVFIGELLQILEVNLPRALAVNAYINKDGTELSIVQVHQDAASLKEHWRVVHKHTGRDLARFVEAPTSTQLYGDAGDTVLDRTRHSAQSGASVSVKHEHIGGFIRMAAGGLRPTES